MVRWRQQVKSHFSLFACTGGQRSGLGMVGAVWLGAHTSKAVLPSGHDSTLQELLGGPALGGSRQPPREPWV
jgi:hypothetical protein